MIIHAATLFRYVPFLGSAVTMTVTTIFIHALAPDESPVQDTIPPLHFHQKTYRKERNVPQRSKACPLLVER